ncbi:MAG: cobalamin-dependent protein, partial [Dehalococcoidia bacterium]|nr:cobalamin-dependent protein [Dehalococcoidia bacterium]
MRPFVLVNANTVRPPIGPVGLEYVAQALVHADIPVEMLDLAFQPEWEKSLARSLSSQDPLAVGIAVRNTDDCCLATGKSFVLWIAQLVAEAKKLTSVPVVLGGGGFSIFPKGLLSATGADIGIYGDGEDAAVLLSRALVTDGEVERIPNLVYRDAGYLRCNTGSRVDAERLPLPLRRMVDNARYQREGAMVGIETKRGCPNKCIYCADPVVKGREMRVRPPRVV